MPQPKCHLQTKESPSDNPRCARAAQQLPRPFPDGKESEVFVIIHTVRNFLVTYLGPLTLYPLGFPYTPFMGFLRVTPQ